MALADIAVITSEPDGTKPRLRFFPAKEAAFNHAQMICLDLNRDAYVVEVKHIFRADRKRWNQEKKNVSS